MAPVRPPSTSTWMTSLPDKNVPLTQLTIPGTHDSFCSENKIEPGIASFNTSFAACQHDSFTTEDQLKAGIRLLDFRVEFDGKLSHGVARLRGNLYDQIRIVANFLEANPGEAVLVSVKWEYESVQKKDGFNLNFEVRGTPEPDGEAGRIIQRLREVPGAKWWMEPTVPTLAQAAGKMVLLTRLADSAKEGIRYEPGNEKLKDIAAPFCSQDHYSMDNADGAGFRKWSQYVEPFLKRALQDPTDGILYFNYLSAYAGSGMPWDASPADVAGPVNRLLMEFTLAMMGRPGLRRFGILMLDFPPTELIQRLVETNLPVA